MLLWLWLSMTVSHFCERREGVKIILFVEGCRVVFEVSLRCFDLSWRSIREVSRIGDHREQVQGMLTSTLLKRGTFMVLNGNDCGFCQWMNLSLARDAYSAISRRASGRQGLFIQCFNRISTVFTRGEETRIVVI